MLVPFSFLLIKNHSEWNDAYESCVVFLYVGVFGLWCPKKRLEALLIDAKGSIT